MDAGRIHLQRWAAEFDEKAAAAFPEAFLQLMPRPLFAEFGALAAATSPQLCLFAQAFVRPARPLPQLPFFEKAIWQEAVCSFEGKQVWQGEFGAVLVSRTRRAAAAAVQHWVQVETVRRTLEPWAVSSSSRSARDGRGPAGAPTGASIFLGHPMEEDAAVRINAIF